VAMRLRQAVKTDGEREVGEWRSRVRVWVVVLWV